MKCPIWLLVSRSRGGGKVRIPGSLRDLQVERKSLFWDFSSRRLFHRLDLLFRQRRQQLSLRAVVSDTVSCDRQGQCLVQMLMNDDFASGHGGAPLGTLDLHDLVVKTYGVKRCVRSARLLQSISSQAMPGSVP